MPNKKISELTAGVATAGHVVAADNEAGTATHKISLSSIAGVGAPKSHAASHQLGGTDALVLAPQQVVSSLEPGQTLFDDINNAIAHDVTQDAAIAANSAAIAALPESFSTASIHPMKVRWSQNPTAGNLQQEIADIQTYMYGVEALANSVQANVDAIYNNDLMHGSWTPQIRNSNNQLITDLAFTSSGRYSISGRTCHVTGMFTITGVPASWGTGSVWITQLPYIINTDASAIGFIYESSGLATGANQADIILYGPSNLPRAKFRTRNISGSTWADAAASIFALNSTFRFSIVYERA